MKSFAAIFLAALSAFGTVESSEFSQEKILDYAGYVRFPKEGAEYVKQLPAEDIYRIADMLDTYSDSEWAAWRIFNMTLIKARDLEKRGISYDADRILAKLTDFVRSRIEKDRSRSSGASAMTSFTGFHHPAIEKLARELVANGNEFERYNAKVWLKQQEAWRRNMERRGGGKHSRPAPPRRPSPGRPGEKQRPAGPESTPAAPAWKTPAAAALLLAAVLFALRSKVGRKP